MTMTHRDILFTGSIGLKNEDEVFHSLAEIICTRAKRYPDGETGARHYWVRWLDGAYKENSQFQINDSNKTLIGYKDKQTRVFYVLTDGVAPDEVDLGQFGYAEYAIESYSKFKMLKNEGIIPAITQFQVSLPTAVAATLEFIEIGARTDVKPAVEKSMMSEVADLAAAIPAAELAIQWDVCFEIVAHDGGPPLHYDNVLGASVERICRHLGWIPEGVEAGIHLCYGDPGHQHIVEPENLATCATFERSDMHCLWHQMSDTVPFSGGHW